MSGLKIVEALEARIGEWVGFAPSQVVACSSGTAALHLACEALELERGGEVLCPDYAMIACPRSLAMAGLEPVFVDCDEELLYDANTFDKAAAHKNVKGVLAVHTYGRYEGMDWLHSGVGAYDLGPVVEDLAEAHGLRPHPSTDAACWSFYKNKLVAGEEGGAVAFRDQGAADAARELRCLGFKAGQVGYVHRPRGMNYRLAPSLAKLVLAALDARAMATKLERVRSFEARLDAACPAEWKAPVRPWPWVYDLRIPGLNFMRQALIVETLNKGGVAARPGFFPCSRQQEFQTSPSYGTNQARLASQEVVYLPLTVPVDATDPWPPAWPFPPERIAWAFETMQRIADKGA